MRKCYACQQMSAVVTVVNRPDGKLGLACPTCYKNRHAITPIEGKPIFGDPTWIRRAITPKPLTDEEKREMEGCGA